MLFDLEPLAKRFVESYLKHPPGFTHRTVVVSQNARPTKEYKALFASLPNVKYFNYDNSGWDIGAFIELSKTMNDDLAVYFGSSASVMREGWLARMVEAWQKHGQGFYGSLATYEISPHINTSGFWCPPKLMAAYPIKVVTKRQRYDFEHGRNAMWKMVHESGLKVLLVTWDGEYVWQEWRKPLNIYRRGDQSNCLTSFRLSHYYSDSGQPQKRLQESQANTPTCPIYIRLRRQYLEPGRVRPHTHAEINDMEEFYEKRFNYIHKFA